MRPLLSLVIILGLYGCGPDPRASILAFGDSVTFGTGAPPGQGWPELLAADTGWQVVNAGIPGDTAAKARNRIAPLLDAHQPALVIVELGGNDFLRKASEATVKESLRTIIDTIQAADIDVVLVAVPRFSLLRATTGALADAELYEELAEEEGVMLVPDVFADVLSDERLRADPIHPNAQGYRQFADGLLSAFRGIGLLVE